MSPDASSRHDRRTEVRIAAALVLTVTGLAAPAVALDYVESSAGLDFPDMEGGRTEFEMADMNQDGYLDLVSIGDHGSPYINTDQHGIMVWFGSPDGTWSVHQEGYFGYGGVAVGDANGDGFPDVGYGMHHDYASTDFGDQLIEVALGDGTGTAWIPWDDGLATNGESWGMFGTDFGDVDCDGDLDLGSNSFGAGSGVHIYLNQGDGTWTQSYGFVGGNSSMDLVFGDIDNDAFLDFAVAHQYGSTYFGDGAGGFAVRDAGLPPGGSLGRRGVDLGDVDGDGGDEFSFVNSDGGVEVWSWDPVGENWVDLSGSLPGDGGYSSTQLVDMNVDGFVDVAAFGGGTCTIWLGDGGMSWTQAATFNTPPSGSRSAFRVGGDTDHNGYPDLIICAREGSWPNDLNHLHFFKETSVPGELSVTPLYPRGGERIVAGSVRFVTWASGVPRDEPSRVALEISPSGPGGPWTTLAEDLPNNGRWQWTASPVASDDCYLRTTVATALDTVSTVTARAFTILADPTPVTPQDGVPPAEARLVGNFPNPFNPRTTIVVELATEGGARLTVHDVAGRRVATLADALLPAGRHEIVWSGRDDEGRALPSGTYTCRLRTGNHTESRPMVLLK